MTENDGEWLDEERNFIIKGPTAIREIEGKKTLVLFDWGRYEIEDVGRDSRDVKIYIGDEEIHISSRGSASLNEYIENRIGVTRFRIVKSGREIKLNFDRAIILSKKIPRIYGIDWRYEDETKFDETKFKELLDLHNKFCDKLTDDITKKCLELPFSLKAPTGFEFMELDEPVSVLFAYHYFRNNFERILSAYETILRMPHKELVEFSELVDFHEATDVDEDCILDIVYHPERLIETSSGIVIIDGKSYAPMRVLQKKKFESFDTPENRFVKNFLSELIIWCDRVLEEYRDKAEAKTDNIEDLRDYLECFWNDPIFSDVSEMTVVPLSSQVLLKKEGYRDVLELWLMFRSYVPFFGELARAIANKDIPKLYEYWCFFKLIEELEKILGKCKFLMLPVSPEAEIEEEGKVYAEFENGWRLYFNKREYSYTHFKYIPDFSLYKDSELEGIFDAKFKVKESHNELKEDIEKMHIYRDGLLIKFAVLIYPKVPQKDDGRNYFYDVREGKKEWVLSELIDVNNGAKMNGIGYLCLKPELKEGSK